MNNQASTLHTSRYPIFPFFLHSKCPTPYSWKDLLVTNSKPLLLSKPGYCSLTTCAPPLTFVYNRLLSVSRQNSINSSHPPTRNYTIAPLQLTLHVSPSLQADLSIMSQELWWTLSCFLREAPFCLWCKYASLVGATLAEFTACLRDS